TFHYQRRTMNPFVWVDDPRCTIWRWPWERPLIRDLYEGADLENPTWIEYVTNPMTDAWIRFIPTAEQVAYYRRCLTTPDADVKKAWFNKVTQPHANAQPSSGRAEPISQPRPAYRPEAEDFHSPLEALLTAWRDGWNA